MITDVDVDRWNAGIDILDLYVIRHHSISFSDSCSTDSCVVTHPVPEHLVDKLGGLGWFTSNRYEWTYRPDMSGMEIVFID